jgi:hypothetical protein
MLTIEEFTYTDKDIICGDKFLNYTYATNNITYLKTDFFIIKKQFIWRNKIHPTIIKKKFNYWT